jgi:hypothetical protein
MPIEFRVQGNNSAAVAQELADQMKVRFQVTPVVRTLTPPQNAAGGAGAEKIDPLSAGVLVVEAAITAYHVYITFVHEPSEKRRQALVRHWMDLVLWSKSKLPTTIRAVIGKESLLLHESDPERLHELTRKAIETAAVIAE